MPVAVTISSSSAWVAQTALLASSIIAVQAIGRQLGSGKRSTS